MFGWLVVSCGGKLRRDAMMLNLNPETLPLPNLAATSSTPIAASLQTKIHASLDDLPDSLV